MSVPNDPPGRVLQSTLVVYRINLRNTNVNIKRESGFRTRPSTVGSRASSLSSSEAGYAVTKIQALVRMSRRRPVWNPSGLAAERGATNIQRIFRETCAIS